MSTAELSVYLAGRELAARQAEVEPGYVAPGADLEDWMTAGQLDAWARLGPDRGAYWLDRGYADCRAEL